MNFRKPSNTKSTIYSHWIKKLCTFFSSIDKFNCNKWNQDFCEFGLCGLRIFACLLLDNNFRKGSIIYQQVILCKQSSTWCRSLWTPWQPIFYSVNTPVPDSVHCVNSNSWWFHLFLYSEYTPPYHYQQQKASLVEQKEALPSRQDVIGWKL